MTYQLPADFGDGARSQGTVAGSAQVTASRKSDSRLLGGIALGLAIFGAIVQTVVGFLLVFLLRDGEPSILAFGIASVIVDVLSSIVHVAALALAVGAILIQRRRLLPWTAIGISAAGLLTQIPQVIQAVIGAGL